MMKKEDLKIVFLGTPDFAVESLKRLHESGYNIVGVVTMPDKVGGRGNKVIQSAVKEYAVANGLPLLQPEKLKDPDFITQLKAWNADLQIVIAFRMLPEVVWNMPPMGTFNLHASLLPKYRGAAPINRAVMNGETTTGVTTFKLRHELDTGDILHQASIPIDITDNVEIVHDKLMTLGADLVLQTVDEFIAGTASATPQDSLISETLQPTPAPKIFKDDCRIDWSSDAMTIYNHIRGLSPYPCAWTMLKSVDGSEISVKVYETSLPQSTKETVLKAGTIIAGKHTISVVCGDGMILELKSLQAAGKKRLTADEFLRGTLLSDKSFC